MDFAYNDKIEGGELINGNCVNEVCLSRTPPMLLSNWPGSGRSVIVVVVRSVQCTDCTSRMEPTGLSKSKNYQVRIVLCGCKLRPSSGTDCLWVLRLQAHAGPRLVGED